MFISNRREREVGKHYAKALDAVALLSTVAMGARRAETFAPETHVIDLADLRQIIFDLQNSDEIEEG